MRKGVQLVSLNQWADASVNRFIDVAKGYTKGTLEIGFAPFFSGDPWKQANTVISQLTSAGVRLKIVVHLSFHRDDPLHKHTLGARAQRFNDEFLTANLSIPMSLCPMLEDEWSHEKYHSVLEEVAGKVSWEKRPKLTFRRSNNKNPAVHGGVSVSYKQGGHKHVHKIPANHVETEIHGPVGAARKAGVYSNDGNFVWFDNPRRKHFSYSETADSAHNAGEADNPAKYPLSTFAKKAAEHGARTCLLWRPAYNLYHRVDPSAKVAVYNTRAQEGRPQSRADDGSAFNEVEQEALHVFLFGAGH